MMQTKQLTTHLDSRGFFREVIRASDPFFEEGFGQWSHSMMFTGTIKAWHIHQKQVDWWYCPVGVIRAVVVDLQENVTDILSGGNPLKIPIYKVQEFILGENQPSQVIKIPPGFAHGLKVLQGPAHLFYITSREYDPDDEGRIPYNALGYDWHKEVIK